MFFRIVSLLLFSQVVMAMPEGQLIENYDKEIWGFYKEKSKSHWFTGEGGKKIHFQTVLQEDPSKEQGALVILPGRTESAFKYAEIVHDLYPYGLSFYIIDHRGQGASDRVSNTEGASHVEGFDFFKKDLETLVQKNMLREHKKKFALAHSMGANILSLFAIEHPDFFDKIILASPMLDIPTEPMPETFTYYLFQAIDYIGKGESFVYGHQPYDPSETYRGTHSNARFTVVKKYRDLFKDQWIGGVTYAFVARCLEATWQMRNHSDQLTMPILMLQAGSDNIVHTEGQDVVCGNAKNCKKVVFPESYHEILMESDSMRDIAMDEIIKFLDIKKPRT